MDIPTSFYVGHQSKLESDGKLYRAATNTALGCDQKDTVTLSGMAQQLACGSDF